MQRNAREQAARVAGTLDRRPGEAKRYLPARRQWNICLMASGQDETIEAYGRNVIPAFTA